MALTYRLEKGSFLTQEEMDNNFRSLFFSSSIQDSGNVLRLHYDTNPTTYVDVPISGGGSGSIVILNDTDNHLLTATGASGSINAEANLQFNGSILLVSGAISLEDGIGRNLLIGLEAGDSISGGTENTAIGYQAVKNTTGTANVAVGDGTLVGIIGSNNNTAIGHSALIAVSSGHQNTALGQSAGADLVGGTGNVYIGFSAGPSGSTSESDQLYINNAAGIPLIAGNFSTGLVTVSSIVSASAFSGSFSGDGSGLTGITVTGSWDGSLEGTARISGSLIVSGGFVDFSNVTVISGSLFSGSFTGDGSALSGITSEWDGTRNGNAEITGSFIVSGSNPIIELKGDTIVDTNIRIHNPATTSVAIGYQTQNVATVGISNVVIGYQAGNNSNLGSNSVVIGPLAGSQFGAFSTYIGESSGRNQLGNQNTAVGGLSQGIGAGSGMSNSALGYRSLYRITTGGNNVGTGAFTLDALLTGINNTAVGSRALIRTTQSNNTALGYSAGEFLFEGSRNVYIGYNAGPSTTTTHSDKLYIANAAGTPLIAGDFALRTVTITGALSVSSSVTATSFTGDGSALTNVVGSWNGIYTGSAEITGSLSVVGPVTGTNFTGSFSGSFQGDGSNLTGIVSALWDGIRSGSAEITGSLDVVGGDINTTGVVRIASGSYPSTPGVELFTIVASGLTSGSNNLYNFEIGATTGYTGFKADYVVTDSTEDSKKIGTLHAGWDRIGNSTVNDIHTVATGDVNTTAFLVDASVATNTIAAFDIAHTAGTFGIIVLVTAFRKQL